MHSFASIVGDALSGKERGRGRRNFKGRGGRSKRSDLQCKHCGKTGHISNQCWASWDSIKDKHNQKKDDQDASKSSDSCIVAHSLEEISTQNGPFNFYSNSMSSCVSQ